MMLEVPLKPVREKDGGVLALHWGFCSSPLCVCVTVFTDCTEIQAFVFWHQILYRQCPFERIRLSG